MSRELVQAVLVLHAFSTLAMTGLIWFVQVVHYPLMSVVGDQFVAYERGHTRRTGAVVGPLMLLEASTAVMVLVVFRGGAGAALAWLGAALLAAVWLSTALVQVPCHRHLQRGFNAHVHARLVASNWIRTVAWTARAAVALALLTA